jgi:phytoene/squalene synthetase
VIDCWNDYENMLLIILEHDKRGNCYLQRHVLEMLSALQFDSKRRHQISSKDELDLYSTLLGRAYTNFILSFISRSVNGKDSAVHLAGYAAHKAHILRDFYQDISMGYYNISNEELMKHGYLKDQLLSADLRPWVFDVVQESYENFKCGLKGIMQLEDLRCRFIGLLISVQYLYVLERIKCNDYVLGRIAIEPNTKEKRYMFRWALRETFLRFNNINTIDKRSIFLLQ